MFAVAALALLQTIPPQFSTLQQSIAALANLVPAGQFYRYSGIFSHAIQTASYMVVLSNFLEHETAASKDDVEKVLGSKPPAFSISHWVQPRFSTSGKLTQG